MAGKYIESEKIDVFPFAKYRPDHLNNRLFYENNLTRLIRQLVDTEGFIISGGIDEKGKTTSVFEINIHGYYFRIEGGTELVDSSSTDSTLTGSSLYACIQLDDNMELKGQVNEQDQFTALYFTTDTPSSTTNLFSIKIAEKVDNNWQLVTTLNQKFSANSLTITEIDGKH